MSLISVIVPVYKVEKYIKKCIDSIVNQTYKNLEIILVDDGSPDACGGICDEYARIDDRVIVIHKENGGLSSARNAGLDIATGDYIAFVDSDDYISENMIEVLYKKIIENNADMALCNFEYVDCDENSIGKLNQLSPIETKQLLQDEMFGAICNSGGWYYIVACNKLYKKEIFDVIRFPIGKIHEDEFVIHHIISKCNKIATTRERLYFYVQRDDSIMGKGFSVKTFHRIQAMLGRSSFFLQKGLVQLAAKILRICTNDFVFLIDRLEIKTKEKRKEIREVKKRFNKLYCEIIKSNIGYREKLKYTILRISVNLYIILTKLLHKTKSMRYIIRNVCGFLFEYYKKKM